MKSMKGEFTDEVRVSSQPIYDMKSGSTWLGWNVADLPPAFLHVRLHLTPRHRGVAYTKRRPCETCRAKRANDSDCIRQVFAVR
jgi:hypothetical protein